MFVLFILTFYADTYSTKFPNKINDYFAGYIIYFELVHYSTMPIASKLKILQDSERFI